MSREPNLSNIDDHVDILLRLLEDVNRGILLSKLRLEDFMDSTDNLNPEQRIEFLSFLRTLENIAISLRDNLPEMTRLTMTNEQTSAWALEIVKTQDALEGLQTIINMISM